MIYALWAAVLDAVDLITTKKVFNVFKNFNNKAFSLWLFIWIIIVGLVVSPWFVQIDSAATTPYYLGLLLLMSFLAANYNLLYYYGLEYEKISEVEPFLLFNPLITILIASMFYADERMWQIYVAAFIASAFLAWSHMRKHQLKIGPPLLAILGYAVLEGFSAVIIKQLLVVYSPLGLYLVRALIVVLFLWILEKGRIARITTKQIPYFILLAVTAIVGNSLIYYAYQAQGISATSLVLMLSPILVYGLSVVILKEKLNWKNIVTSAIVMALIIWVTILI